MKTGSAARVASALSSEHSVAVTFHAHPDGDASASAFLLALGLLSVGKKPVIVNPDGDSPAARLLLERIPPLQRIPVVSPSAAVRRCRCLVVLDSSNPQRAAWDFTRHPWQTLINVDHHADNSGFGSINFVDSAAPAASHLVAKILARLRVQMTPELADIQFVSLYSDTAGLTITSPRIREDLRIVLKNGADVPGLNGLLRRKPLSAFLLQTRVFGRLSRPRPGVLWTWSHPSDLAASGASYSDFDSITEELSRIRDADVFFLLKPTSRNRWKASIRSRGLNVRSVAARFGGGGHDRAAGFEISGTPADCARRILRLLPRGK